MCILLFRVPNQFSVFITYRFRNTSIVISKLITAFLVTSILLTRHDGAEASNADLERSAHFSRIYYYTIGKILKYRNIYGLKLCHWIKRQVFPCDLCYIYSRTVYIFFLILAHNHTNYQTDL